MVLLGRKRGYSMMICGEEIGAPKFHWARARAIRPQACGEGRIVKPGLYRMFYPLDEAEQTKWAEIVQLPAGQYEERVDEEAANLAYIQEDRGGGLVWLGEAGNPELMLFRIPDPGNLDAIRKMYDTLAETNCPVAYAFVNQRGDAETAWDVFQLSRLSYLCHCNRIAGPGSSCDE